jgi:branched-chain amino acid transport system substrate-binding protein
MIGIIRNIILIGIVVLSGCAPMRPPVSEIQPTPEIPVPERFQAADQAFENGQYAEALDGFNTFLRQAYDDRLVDAALFKVGKILRLTGRDTDAMAVFMRLKHEYPQSAWVPDAMLEVLNILFDNEKYEAVVASGIAFTETVDPNLQRSPFYLVIAEAYAALGAPLDAARYQYRALVTASEEGEEEIAWDKLKSSVEQLTAEDIQQLVTQVTDQRAIGFLLYRLGMAFILEEKYDDALEVLTAFVERFPEHPDYQDASDMIHTLVERSRFTPFTVGCVLPLSGSYALFGQRALEGIELALSRFGETGRGLSFRIVVKDSRSDPDTTEAAVEELDQQRVGAILGPMAMSESAAATAQSRGIPIIVFTQREGVPDIGTYVFRNFITPEMQAQSLVTYAVNQLDVKRFAILYPDEKYGRRYMNLFWDQVIGQGRVVNGVEAYDPEGTDFAKPIKKLAGIFYDVPKDLTAASLPSPVPMELSFPADPTASARRRIIDPVEALTGIPLDRDDIDALGRRKMDQEDQWNPIVDFDAVFIPDAPKKAGLVIPQLAYYDIRDIYLLGTNLWNSQTLLEMTGEYLQKTLITDGFFAQSQSDNVKDFVSVFQDAYDRPPGIIEALAYDSALMIFQTMRQTASDSRRDLKEALQQIDDFKGVSGRTGFALNGEAIKELQMLRIEKGRFTTAHYTARPRSDMESP